MNKKILIITILILLVVVSVLLLTVFKNNQKEERTLRIAASADFAGGPIYVIEELNLLDKYIKNVKIDYNYTGAGAGSVINEMFASNRLDAGAFGITHILTGIDKKLSYKIASSIYSLDFGFQTCNQNIKSLKDVGKEDRIAVSGFTGSQAMALYLASMKQLGDYYALKDQIVTMPLDQATLALINGAGVTISVSPQPQKADENAAGCKTILRSSEVNENLMSGYLVFTEEFYNTNHDIYKAFMLAIEEAVNLINDQDEKAIEALSRRISIDKATIISYLNSRDIIYKMFQNDFQPYIDIAFKIEIISSKKEIKDMMFK